MAEDAADNAADPAWSGVHRGALRAGDWVRLVDGKGRKHNFCLEPGKRFFSNKGHLEHDDLIGREEGFTVTSSGGGEKTVLAMSICTGWRDQAPTQPIRKAERNCVSQPAVSLMSPNGP